MIGEDIRELQRAVPFEPYTVYTNDGKGLYVKHPDYLLIAPGNQTLWVFANEKDREMVAVQNITRIVPGAKKTPRSPKR